MSAFKPWSVQLFNHWNHILQRLKRSSKATSFLIDTRFWKLVVGPYSTCLCACLVLFPELASLGLALDWSSWFNETISCLKC